MYCNTSGIWILLRSRIKSAFSVIQSETVLIRLPAVPAICRKCYPYQYQREKEYKIELLDLQLQDFNEDLYFRLTETPDSLWNSVLNSYISQSTTKELRVTIINPLGVVLYDSYEHNISPKNHQDRPEVQQALKHRKGHDVRRTSETTGVPYFIQPQISDPTSSVRHCLTILT